MKSCEFNHEADKDVIDKCPVIVNKSCKVLLVMVSKYFYSEHVSCIMLVKQLATVTIALLTSYFVLLQNELNIHDNV